MEAGLRGRVKKRICEYPGCTNTIKSGSLCPLHKTWRPSPSRRGYNETWRRIRRDMLAENLWCEICGGYADTVHHIVPLRKGGGHDPANLVVLCRSCHNRIHGAGGG